MVLKELETHIRYKPGVHIDVFRTHDDKLVDVAVFSGEMYHKNLISIASQIGCPVDCTFCYVGEYERDIKAKEYLQQVEFVLANKENVPWFDPKRELKVCLTREGEPLLNNETDKGLIAIAVPHEPSFQLTTIMPSGKKPMRLLQNIMGFFKDYDKSFQINISMHTTDEEKRKEMIRYGDLMSYKEIAEFGEQWNKITDNRKVNLSFVLMKDVEVDVQRIAEIFNPMYFSVRFALYLPCTKGLKQRHKPMSTIYMATKAAEAKKHGFECIESIASDIELAWHTRPGIIRKLSRE
jgi:adenine C2-methylase RlmN of 23S rRNA A2503 and tRNA A37